MGVVRIFSKIIVLQVGRANLGHVVLGCSLVLWDSPASVVHFATDILLIQLLWYRREGPIVYVCASGWGLGQMCM